MDEQAATVSGTHAADLVEILDNGVVVGTADLVNGQWSYTRSGMALGAHSFTARYRAVTTATPWRVTVEEPVHTDDLSDAPVGVIHTVNRPYYVIYGFASGSQPSQPTYKLDDRFPGIGPTVLWIVGIRYIPGGTSAQSVEMRFNGVYSEVSFDVYAYYNRQSQVGPPGPAIAQVLDAQNQVLESHQFVVYDWPDRRLVRATLRAQGGRAIKTLKISASPAAGTGYADVWAVCDNFKMLF